MKKVLKIALPIAFLIALIFWAKIPSSEEKLWNGISEVSAVVTFENLNFCIARNRGVLQSANLLIVAELDYNDTKRLIEHLKTLPNSTTEETDWHFSWSNKSFSHETDGLWPLWIDISKSTNLLTIRWIHY